MTNRCDIIIPTYNNEAVIARTLLAIYQQILPKSWQCRILISDDGSTDQTISIARNIKPPPSWLELVVLSGEHNGAALARNRGIAAATAPILLLLGSDILLRPGALSAHLDWHQHHPEPTSAALGFVLWDPVIKPTPLMEWMNHGGTQNNFDELLGISQTDPNHFFYGSHLSGKRTILQEGFSGAFQGYGWEDLDLGRRLKKIGLTLHVLHHAVGLHSHFYQANQIFQRQVEVGKNLIIYQSKHQDVQLLPQRSWKSRLFHLLCYYSGVLSVVMFMVSKTSSSHNWPRVYKFIMSALLYKGINQGYKDKRSTYPHI